MKGKFTSNCGHLPTPWPYLPQENHNTIAQSLWAVAGRDCGACVSVPGNRHFNIASISVCAARGGGACSGKSGSRRFSIVSIPVAAERGGGACAGTAGRRRFSITSRSANPTEGPVTAATTCSVGPSAGSLTAYTSLALSGVSFTTLRSSVSAWLSHTHTTISRMGVSGGTQSRCRRRTQFG